MNPLGNLLDFCESHGLFVDFCESHGLFVDFPPAAAAAAALEPFSFTPRGHSCAASIKLAPIHLITDQRDILRLPLEMCPFHHLMGHSDCGEDCLH